MSVPPPVPSESIRPRPSGVPRADRSSLSELPGAPDLEHLSAFLRAVEIDWLEVSADRVLGAVDLGPQHHQPWGVVHGGVYASIVETTASMGAAVAAAEHGAISLGVNNNTHFVRAVREERVDVTAEPLHQGRSGQLWQVTITGADGRLVATGQLRTQHVPPPPPDGDTPPPPAAEPRD